MISDDTIFKSDPFSWEEIEKNKYLKKMVLHLTRHHAENCREYRKILEMTGVDINKIEALKDIPFLPVSLFKKHDLKSINAENIFKTMVSSGTTGALSKIYLDKETSNLQMRALMHIMSDFIGKERLTMFIIDKPSVINNRKKYSARGAAILGFSLFSNNTIFALNEDSSLNMDSIQRIQSYQKEKILIFGFTYIIWKFFLQQLNKLQLTLNLPNAIVIHGGGWKKLSNEAISNDCFKMMLKKLCNIERCHNYYGMVEQTGTIYVECECGYFHASNYSEIFIRNKQDFSVCNYNESGIIQTISCVPYSYPGHSLLTEDEGIIIGDDKCICGRKGKIFKVLGRMKQAEIRGCGDAYE